MHFRLTCVAIVVMSAELCRGGQQSAAFLSEVNLVNVTAVVRSPDGHLQRGLGKDDFDLSEDGVPQQIRFFARESDLPLALGIIVDVSGSQEKFLKRHRNDVVKFLNKVLRPSDRAFAVCFGNHVRLVSEPSSDSDAIIAGLEQFQKGDRHFPEIGPSEERDLGTAFYDALYFSISEKLKAAGGRRRALIIFSDGEENSSEHDLMDVIEEAQNTDTLIYCVRYTESKHGQVTARNKYGTRAMHHISSLTGAADFDGLAAPLDSVFAQISEELHSMYQMAYVSSNTNRHDGSYRKLTIHCRQAGSVVRSKGGYYAE